MSAVNASIGHAAEDPDSPAAEPANAYSRHAADEPDDR